VNTEHIFNEKGKVRVLVVDDRKEELLLVEDTFLEKPFSVNTLLQKARSVLDTFLNIY